MADNILVESARLEPVTLSSNGSHGQLTKASPDVRKRQNLKASYILDFGDLLHGKIVNLRSTFAVQLSVLSVVNGRVYVVQKNACYSSLIK